MALLMAAANGFELMASATADDNREVIAWMTDSPSLSLSYAVSGIDRRRGARPSDRDGCKVSE